MNARMIRRLAAQAALAGVAVICLLVALGFVVAAIFLGFSAIAAPAMAALLTALVFAFLGLLLVLLASLLRPRRQSAGSGALGVVPGLQMAVGRHPWMSLAVAIGLGALRELTGKPRPRR